MNKLPFKSKKFIALIAGISFNALFAALSLFLIAGNPESATAIVNLMTVSLASVNGLISLYAIGQSAVDWKINPTNANIAEQTSSIEETKKLEVSYEGAESLNWD